MYANADCCIFLNVITAAKTILVTSFQKQVKDMIFFKFFYLFRFFWMVGLGTLLVPQFVYIAQLELSSISVMILNCVHGIFLFLCDVELQHISRESGL